LILKSDGVFADHGPLYDLIRASHCGRILYAQHIEREGKKFFTEICARDLEGIVAKQKLGVYRDDGTRGSRSKTGRTHRLRDGTSC